MLLKTTFIGIIISQSATSLVREQLWVICDNQSYIEEIHYMYDIPIVPLPDPRRRRPVRKDDEFDEIAHNVEELPSVMQMQSQTDYVNPMMMPAFDSGYYDS
ncbi:uncharacterized protein LOC120071680 [Benincasa hispida]|uniref:uncharacterized protein LOC120071680 n=1 Tax=Benincasa hispida TaxID=102211 RepID=UPI0018FF402D|nr:uncharacterized protein LOC120071680 [Benincasa hispida]